MERVGIEKWHSLTLQWPAVYDICKVDQDDVRCGKLSGLTEIIMQWISPLVPPQYESHFDNFDKTSLV